MTNIRVQAHGDAPSRTSQWYSVDLGLIHFVMLDLDPGPPAVFAGAQAAWAAADLAAADANRANVPWIVQGLRQSLGPYPTCFPAPPRPAYVLHQALLGSHADGKLIGACTSDVVTNSRLQVVTSHFPVYSAEFYAEGAWNASAAWYSGEVAETERGMGPWSATPHFESCAKATGSRTRSAGNGTATCTTVKDVVDASIASLGALLDQHHVDIYAAGHVHSYSTTWPLFNGAVANKSFVDPHGTVHVLEGNGGVPGTLHGRYATSTIGNCTRSARQEPVKPLAVFRNCGRGGNYGRLLTTNASVLTYEHVANGNGKIMDSWSIVKTAY